MDYRSARTPMPETTIPPGNGTVEGLPGWYFVLVGLLVASNELSLQFSDRYSWVAVLPLVLVAVHLTLCWASTRFPDLGNVTRSAARTRGAVPDRPA